MGLAVRRAMEGVISQAGDKVSTLGFSWQVQVWGSRIVRCWSNLLCPAEASDTVRSLKHSQYVNISAGIDFLMCSNVLEIGVTKISRSHRQVRL